MFVPHCTTVEDSKVNCVVNSVVKCVVHFVVKCVVKCVVNWGVELCGDLRVNCVVN